MEIVIASEAELARRAADEIVSLVAEKPSAVIGIATGSSPVVIYDELARRVRAGELSLAHCTAFALDEYVGLPVGHPESYVEVMHRDFSNKVDIDDSRVHAPNGAAEDLVAAAEAYEKAIADAGGVDLQLLGIGANGHIAFNEAGSPLTSRTHVEDLTERTRRDNSRFFDDDLSAVPFQGLTQGVGTIMEARKLVMIATGLNKADAVVRMIEGPVTQECSSSALQNHPNAIVLLDEDAASKLTRSR